MENKNIIVVLLIIIVIILAVMVAMMAMPSLNAQKDSKIAITSNKTLHKGDYLSVKLTDLNKTPIEKGVVNITVLDKNGKVVVEKSLKTNSKGKAKLNLDLEPGKYKVNVTFGGNVNFTASNITKKITIEEVVEEPVVVEQSTTSDTGDSYSNEEELRPEVDSTGITREQADKYGWRYTTEHGGHYRGYHDHWDENAGFYHD